MPPRKSIDLSKAATGDESTPAKEASVREGVNIEDLNLPKSIVTRLAKGVLPPNTQIQGNAMLAMTKSATVFVNYLATHANEHAQRSSRKTIAPQDVFLALDDLEFPDFKPRLEAELAKFVELQTDKRNTYRKKVAADKAAGKAGSPPPGEEESFLEGDDGEGQMDRDGQPAAKKARMDESGIVRKGGIPDRHGEGEEGEEDEGGDDPEDDEEEEGDEEEERHDTEEQLEEPEEKEAEDEALDSGEDSD